MARGPRELLLATHNEHKRREFERLLAQRRLALVGRWRCSPTRSRCRPRPADTFAENALGKARAAAGELRRVRASPTTPGIAAAALGGAPGVRSARYAGEHASDARTWRS